MATPKADQPTRSRVPPHINFTQQALSAPLKEAQMKAAVVYHSESGNTAKMGGLIVEGLKGNPGIDARAFNLDDLDKDFIKESKVILVGTPVYTGTFTAKMKTWLDGGAQSLNMGGKLAGAFATANFIHGGADVAILGILNHFLVYGSLVYSGGVDFGQPFIHYGPVAIAPELENFSDLFKAYGQRVGQKALELFKA